MQTRVGIALLMLMAIGGMIYGHVAGLVSLAGALGSLLSFATLFLAFFLLRREVAARMWAEQAQREAEARCRLLFECHPHPMSIYDNETLALLAVNEAAVYQYGYTQEEFLAMTIKDVRPPEDIPVLLANVAKRTASFDAGSRGRHRRKDGTIIDVEVTSHALTFAGRPARLVQAQDITARTRAEAAQRRYAERLQILHEIDRAILAEQFPETIVSAAIGHIHALLCCWRVNISVFDFASHQGIVLGWTGSGTPRFPIGTRLPLEEYGSQDLEALQAGKVHVVEDIQAFSALPATIRTSQADGLRAYVRVPLIVHDELIGVLNLMADHPGAFTAEEVDVAREVADQLAVALQQARLHAQVQRHAEELERRVAERTARLMEINAELEAFTYSVSHDLRTPLRSIYGFSRILLDDYVDRLDTRGHDYLQRVLRSAQHMRELIDALLMLSRLTQAELQRTPVDLSALARTIATELQQQEPTRQVECRIAEELQASGDSRLLRIVLENLLGNAWKYTAKHAQARIEVGAMSQPGEQLAYFVRDDGAGFDMAYADKLFGVFQRLHGPSEFAGTGIGLATVQRIIHRHGGRVWAEAAVDQGATFYFTLGGDTAHD